MLNFIHTHAASVQSLAKPICDKLSQFYQCVSQQDTMRFYSSSLLIMYDGAPDATQANTVDVRAVDFAHAEYDPTQSHNTGTGPDVGYLQGIQTLIDIFSEVGVMDDLT